MPLTTEEVIINLTESIEDLLKIIEYAENNGIVLPTERGFDIESAKDNLVTVYNKDYDDVDLMDNSTIEEGEKIWHWENLEEELRI